MTQVPLADVCEVFNGKTPSKAEQRSSGYPVLKIKDVTENGVFRGKFESFVDDDFSERHSAKKIRKDDILILNAAHNADYVGSKGYFATEEVEGAIATGEWLIVRANKEHVEPSFVWHWIQSPSTRFQIKKLVKGIHLYPRDVSRLKFPLYEPKEQKRIAAILDKADAIRRKRQQAIQLADEFLRSVFLDMFGDPAINPMAWSKSHIGALVILGPDNGIFKKNGEYGDGVPVVWVEQLYKGDVLDIAKSRRLAPTEKELKKYGLNKGDIVFCRSSLKREGIGFNNIYDGADGGALFECHMTRIRLNQNQVNPYFVNFLLKMKNMRRHVIAQSKTVTMTTIDQDGISRIEIIVPPKDKQDKFAKIFRSVIEQKHNHIRFNDEANHAFSSLNQRAFQGVL